MAGRPKRRPQGKCEDAAAGTDTVDGAAPGGSPVRSHEEAAADDSVAVPASPVDRATLDQRERRQSSERKPAGPEKRRIATDDVVIDDADSPGAALGDAVSPPPPTEPGD